MLGRFRTWLSWWWGYHFTGSRCECGGTFKYIGQYKNHISELEECDGCKKVVVRHG